MSRMLKTKSVQEAAHMGMPSSHGKWMSQTFSGCETAESTSSGCELLQAEASANHVPECRFSQQMRCHEMKQHEILRQHRLRPRDRPALRCQALNWHTGLPGKEAA